jgi:CRP/FNR family cyclic AMP-dependent transcriptional regulator
MTSTRLSFTGLGNRRPLAEPLRNLPWSHKVEYRKGQIIYGPDQPSVSLYLVIAGMVKSSRSTHEGRQVIGDIYQDGEFFGETAFLGSLQRSEQVTALENTQLMAWTASDIESSVLKMPRLGIALLQMLGQREIVLKNRVESFAVDNTTRRLVLALIYFSDRAGVPESDGSLRIMQFTHDLLAQYVGTSRAMVTHLMNHLRKQGHVRYSRKAINVYRAPLLQALQEAAVGLGADLQSRPENACNNVRSV